MSSRAVLGDHTVRQHMIAPIAIAWHRVHATTGAAGRIQRGAATLEITLRVVAAIALTDYLRGPPDPRVEQQLERLSRPSLGTWLGIAREALRAVRERTGPAPFVPEAVDAWFDAKGGPTPALRRLDELVALRNQLQHGGGVGGESTDAAHAATLVEGLREVLASLSWLLRYRVFRVVDQQPTRAQTVRGRVQFFVGLSAGDPVSAEWTATLFPDAVYLCDPTAQAVLELSPLLWMLPEPSLGVERPFLVHAVHKSGDLVLNWDETGHSERRRIQGANGPVDWPTWLDERTSRDPVQANRDVAGTLTSPLGQATAGVTALDGRFTLGEHLGEGGMAVVYRAHDRLTDAEVAVKVLRPEVAADPEVRARFKREGATMAAMRHPRVLSGVTLGESADGSLYLAMPLYAGGTVADRLSAGKVTDDDRARWSRQLLEALVHLASMRVVHRDIKPSNLLLDDAGDLVLSDFGIALGARDARLTRTLTQLGSLAYMAPESRTGSVDSASDAWSAAVVLHELHTGELPRGRPGDGMPGPIGELTRSLGAIDPSERPSAANALAALDGQPGLLHPALIEGSNDERVLVVGALGGLMGALLLVVPLFTSQPASVIADWALPLSPAVAWSGWPLAVLGFGLVGASVGRRQFGEGPLPGALAGAIAALVAFSLGGAAPVAVAAQLHLVSPEVYAGANLVSVMADAVVGTLWGVFGGALALTAVGGAAGVLGAWWARPEGPPSKAVNDVRDHGGYLGGMTLLVHLVAAALGLAVGTMAESVLSGLPDAPGVALLAYGSELWLGLYFLLPALALTVMHHPLLRASLRSETRSERVYAWMHAVALVVMPWIGVLFSGMQVWSLVLAVCGLVGAAVVVDAWRSARGLGHPVWSQDPNPRISLWGAALLAVCALTATPMVVGAVFGMFAVSSIQALQGYAPPPDPARALDPVRELTLTLWLLALVWASVVAAVAWVAERPERRSRAVAVLAGVAVVAALGVVSTSWQSLGGVWFVLLAVVVVGLTGGVYELIRVAAGRLRGAPPAWEWTVSAAFLAVSCLVFGVLYGPLFLGYRPWGSLDPADEVVGPDLGDSVFATCREKASSPLEERQVQAALACGFAGRPPGEVATVVGDSPEAVALRAALGPAPDPVALLAMAQGSPLLEAWIADQFPDRVEPGPRFDALTDVRAPAALVGLLRARHARREGGPAAALASLDAELGVHDELDLRLVRLEALLELDPARALDDALALSERHPGRLDVRTLLACARILTGDRDEVGRFERLAAERTTIDPWDEVRVVWATLAAFGPEPARQLLRTAIERRLAERSERSASVLLRTQLALAASHPAFEGDVREAAERLAELRVGAAVNEPWVAWSGARLAAEPEPEQAGWPALTDAANADVWRVPCGIDWLHTVRRADAAPERASELFAAFVGRADRRCSVLDGRAYFVGLARERVAASASEPVGGP